MILYSQKVFTIDINHTHVLFYYFFSLTGWSVKLQISNEEYARATINRSLFTSMTTTWKIEIKYATSQRLPDFNLKLFKKVWNTFGPFFKIFLSTHFNFFYSQMNWNSVVFLNFHWSQRRRTHLYNTCTCITKRYKSKQL